MTVTAREQKFCRVCGKRLVPYTGSQGYAWNQCPDWPKGPWWRTSDVEHDHFPVQRTDWVFPFDGVTGEKLA